MCLAATADKDTAELAVAEVGGQKWHVGSGEQSVVFGHAATKAWANGMSTAGSRLVCRLVASGEKESEAAAGVRGSEACHLVRRKDVRDRANTAGCDGQLQGSGMDVAEMDTAGRTAHAMESAAVWDPCYGSLRILRASAVPAVEAHTAACPAAMDIVGRREGHSRQLELGEGRTESATASAQWATSSARALLPAQRWLC